MKNISLAAKYRPQDFASIVGQDTVKSVLQKTAFQEKVAPAYLLSGTRGVGKTTIARVFAKALNCENKADNNGEPCNNCETCKRITLGSYIDVIEIDGASNRGIEDARKLRETVIYPPFEGKYRVVIIDEAHMLTPESFNALLKTLEEPPAHTTFVLATTESHKFPITIISRCQHFVFKNVPDVLLASNMQSVLTKENWQYEEAAINILTKRAAGSVRDSMSLLDQCLVLANDNKLTAELTRSVLGLASAEIIDKMLNAIAENDSAAISYCVQDMMMQAIDITYFTRNLTQLWRSLFIIKHQAKEAQKILAISDDEYKELLEQAEKFSLAFVHSAWQMTLDVQQKIIHSLEPAVALELFLINLTLLPKLLPIQELRADMANLPQENNTSEEKKNLIEKPKAQEPHPNNDFISQKDLDEGKKGSNSFDKETGEVFDDIVEITENISPEEDKENSADIADKEDKSAATPINSLNFADFISFLREKEANDLLYIIQHINGVFSQVGQEKILNLKASSEINSKQIKAKDFHSLLIKALEEWSNQIFTVEISLAKPPKSHSDLKEELEKDPLINEIQSAFNAHIVFCQSINNDFIVKDKK